MVKKAGVPKFKPGKSLKETVLSARAKKAAPKKAVKKAPATRKKTLSPEQRAAAAKAKRIAAAKKKIAAFKAKQVKALASLKAKQGKALAAFESKTMKAAEKAPASKRGGKKPKAPKAGMNKTDLIGSIAGSADIPKTAVVVGRKKGPQKVGARISKTDLIKLQK